MKHSKGDHKGKSTSPDEHIPSSLEIAEDKQAMSSASHLIVKKQPTYPPPFKPAPPSGNLLMSILPKTFITKKAKNETKDNESKKSLSPVSSKEPVLDTSLDKDVKEDKKTAEAKPDTSPTSSTPNSEEASMLSDFLGNNNGITNEEEIKEDDLSKEKLTLSSDVLGELSLFIAEESSEDKQETTQEESKNLEGYLRIIRNNDTASQIWCNASEYPAVVAM